MTATPTQRSWSQDDGPDRGPAPRPEPTWLSPEQQRDWRAYLHGVAVLNDRLGEALEEEFGLSLSEYELLVRLSESPDHSLRMSELARELVHSRSRVTYAVSSMERRGLVTRCAATGDGRGVSCRMTPDGWQLLQEAAKAHVASVRASFVDVIGARRLHQVGQAMTLVVEAAAAAAAEGGRVGAGH